MYLTAFLHRDELFEITNRWLSDKLAPEDPLTITKIITYDSFAAWEMLLVFIDGLLGSLIAEPIYRKKIADKKELKGFICNPLPSVSNRTRDLISSYKEKTEFYYTGSPIAGYIYHAQSLNIVGISRFKRVKRIAEKASRYASLYLLKEVEAVALKAAKHQVNHSGENDTISMDQMIQAEGRVMNRIKETGIALPVQSMTIKDILGLKVIDTDLGEKYLEAAISEYPGAEIIEKESHTGHYNAVHYVIELRVDFDFIVRRFKEICTTVNYSTRGLSKNNILEDFEKFISTGADRIQLDLILTTYEELVESEIGRSMHESRIFKQRQQQGYSGNIPTNVEYIIEYLLAVGLSPAVHIDEIPIKTWGRYLPDTLSYKIRKLYGMPEYCLIEF